MRFINADGQIDTSISGINMFAYCGNNPVGRADPSGAIWIEFNKGTGENAQAACRAFENIIVLIAKANYDFFLGGFKERADAMQANPSASNIANWLTCGISGRAAGAVNPDEPWSLQHWLDSLSTACLFFPAISAASKTAGATADVFAAAPVHGNSLLSAKPTVGYALRDQTGVIIKYGETSYPNTRYTKKFLNETGYWMDIMATGSKYEMHYWQRDRILEYKAIYGKRPPENLGLY